MKPLLCASSPGSHDKEQIHDMVNDFEELAIYFRDSKHTHTHTHTHTQIRDDKAMKC